MVEWVYFKAMPNRNFELNGLESVNGGPVDGGTEWFAPGDIDKPVILYKPANKVYESGALTAMQGPPSVRAGGSLPVWDAISASVRTALLKRSGYSRASLARAA
jgi:hypothetical protein